MDHPRLWRAVPYHSLEEVLSIESLKESIYKAMHPLICQNVGFQEVEVTPNSNGTANVKYMLQSNAHLNFEETSVHWQRITLAVLKHGMKVQ